MKNNLLTYVDKDGIPKENGYYLVYLPTYDEKDRDYDVQVIRFDLENSYANEFFRLEVVAYMKIPNPKYIEVSEE